MILEIEWNPDNLFLLKLQIDEMLSQNKLFQKCLDWINQKSERYTSYFQKSAIRASYLSFCLCPGFYPSFEVENRLFFKFDIELVYQLDVKLATILISRTPTTIQLYLDLIHAFIKWNLSLLSDSKEKSLVHNLEQLLQKIQTKVDKLEGTTQKSLQDNQHILYIELENLINYLFNLKEHQFSIYNSEMIRRYYQANKILIDCIENSCLDNEMIRKKIEGTLLLPLAEIEKRKRENIE